MTVLFPIIQRIAMNGLASKEAPFSRKTQLGTGFILLAGLFLVMAFIFAAISCHAWLLTQYPEPMAALLMAAAVGVLGVFLALTSILIFKKKKHAAAPSNDMTEIMAAVTELAGDEFADTIKDNPKTAILLASVAGFVAGDRLN